MDKYFPLYYYLHIVSSLAFKYNSCKDLVSSSLSHPREDSTYSHVTIFENQTQVHGAENGNISFSYSIFCLIHSQSLAVKQLGCILRGWILSPPSLPKGSVDTKMVLKTSSEP